MTYKLCLALVLMWTGSIQLLSAQSNALNFDGIDDHVLTTFQGPTGNQARSVEAWIRTTANADPNNGGVQKVIMDWGNMATGSRFTFNLLFFNGLRIEVQGSGLNSTRALNDGLWHHVAAVYDPSLTTQQFKLYIDGLLDTAANLPTPVNTSNLNSLRLGRRLDGIHHFEGEMDEIRCWNVALSAAQILNSYNNEFCNLPAGLAAYYTLNAGIAGGSNISEITAFDRVANNHGTLQNFALVGSTSNWVAGIVNSPVTVDTLQITACDAYTSIGGTLITSSGVIIDTLLSANGCDSLVRQEVTIPVVNTSISLSQLILSAQSPLATAYQWLDCDNGFAPISGATQASFQPTANGSYAVLVTEGSCSDTSGCLTVMGVSVHEQPNALALQLYPNPNQGVFEIRTAQWLQGGEWSVADMQGRKVAVGFWSEGDKQQLSLEHLQAGQYIFRLESGSLAPGHLLFIKN
jgi:hypothetical protein